ncbi:hypothetical protein MMC25_004282 [Agyrium rufum]|nr:hypothetical protein [Agyrium rufum]
MGQPQSKPVNPVIERRLAQRIQALSVQDQEIEAEKDYVHITDEKGHHAPYQTTVSISTTAQWEKKLMEDPKNRLALAALSVSDAKAILTQPSAVIADVQNFNVKIALEGAPITNQRSSGRCWLFAATNVFRVAIMRAYNLEKFELSQAYLFYWDKIEKANYFLEQILDTVGEDLDGRLVQALLSSPVGDGGQWDMAANLVEKYGLVPQVLYPDNFNAMNSSTMDKIVTTKLREDALKLRKAAASSSDKSELGYLKAKMMQEIHSIVTLMLGPPPNPRKDFQWEYYDKNGKYHMEQTTPLRFASELSSSSAVRANAGSDVNELFSLVNDPRNKYDQLLTVSRLGNVVGLRPIRYVNVDMATIKTSCILMLKAGLPVFFGSDVGQFSNRTGIMDTALIDYELGFNIKLGMSKTQRLMTGESAMTHAMVLTGVQVEESGFASRWRVQNSWGEAAGKEGWFVMTDPWMDEFVYQAVVDPRYVKKEVREILNQKPLVLPLWDPMGALA